MIWPLVALTLCWLLGHLGRRALRVSGPGIDGDGLDILALELFFGLALALWAALLLAQIGWLSLTSWIGVLAVVGALLAVLGSLGSASLGALRFEPRTWGSVAIIAVLLAGSAWLYLPPFEQIAGGSDPTTYLLWGIRVAREGSWVDHDPLVAAMNADQVEVFFGPGFSHIREHYASRFLGFYLEDPSTGRVVPQGFPLYPMTVAVGYLIGGIRGALAATPLLAMAGVLALFLVGRRLLGPWGGGLAAAWLMVSPAQVWFARYANAEIAAQVFLFAGLFAWLVGRSRSQRFADLVAGFCIGLSLLAHAWMIFVAAGLYLLCGAQLIRRRRRPLSAWFWGPLGLLVAHVLITAATHAWPYVSDLLLGLATSDSLALPFDFRRFPWLLVLAAGGGLVLCWLAGRARLADRLDGLGGSRLGHGIRGVAAGGVVSLAYLGAVVRPEQSETWRALSIPQLIAAVEPAGFWLAVAGVVLALVAVRSWRTESTIALLLLPAVVAVLFRPMIRPEMMWSLRRYVPVILPFLFLFGALALVVMAARLGGRVNGGERGRPRLVHVVAVGIAAGAGLYQGVQLAKQGIPLSFVQHREQTVALVEEMADSLEDEALLVFEARSGWRALDYAPALAYWKGMDVLNTFQKQPREPVFRDYLWGQMRGERPIYTFTQGFNYYFERPAAIPVRPWVEPLEELESSDDRLPTRTHSNRIVTRQYRLEAGRRNVPQAGDSIDCGSWDDYFVGEMYAPEHDGREYFRWTEGNGRLWLAGIGPDPVRIVLRLGAPGADLGLDRSIMFRLDGDIVATAPARPGLHEYPITLPADPDRPFAPALQLDVEPFVPARLGTSGDRRWLGVRCYSVRWEPLEE